MTPRPCTATDVAVVIPTRDRWPTLQRTLEGLRHQTVHGFETVVVVDGLDQQPPPLDQLGDVRVLVKEHGGPGAARNAGARATERPILLFLGDDMVPTPELVRRHVAVHDRHRDDAVAVLGHVDWHPEVARGRYQRWLDWSGTQFDYRSMSGEPTTGEGGEVAEVLEEAGFGRFYSCNVSLRRRRFLDIGGFDEAFTYYYEDLDCGYRLHQKGMRLLYEPAARAEHLHRYDRAALERRFRGTAEGEHLMATVHPWFTPYFLQRVRTALGTAPVGGWWPALVDLVPPGAGRLRRAAERRADTWYHQHLAEPFLAGWAAAEDLLELRQYLGERYDHRHLVRHREVVDAERAASTDEGAFYRTSESYLYDLTAFAMSGTKAPYLAELRALVRPGGRLLDFGCGIGADGLRLAAAGYAVSFADFANPSTAYLRWRLARRGLALPVFDLDADVGGGFDAAFSFDVIEHVDDPYAFLAELERRASLVIVNFLEEEPDDTDLHRPLPIPALLDYAADRGLVRYRRYHGRSHLVAYRSPTGPAAHRWRAPVRERLRSATQRRLGGRLGGRPGWYPVPGP